MLWMSPFVVCITRKGLITIGKRNNKWVEARAEYIKGGCTQTEIAQKYGIPYNTVVRKASDEGWTKLRKEAARKAGELAQEKIAERKAEAAVENAAMLEKARRLLIERILETIEQMPKKSGTRVRQSKTDRDTGQQVSVDYDLQTLITAYEKLSEGATADGERQKQFAKENNSTILGYADLFKRAARQRTIEELESGGGEDV